MGDLRNLTQNLICAALNPNPAPNDAKKNLKKNKKGIQGFLFTGTGHRWCRVNETKSKICTEK